MTLRHRLLLVYLILVLLTASTVGVAVFELQHSHQIIADLQDWHEIVLNVEKLNFKWSFLSPEVVNLKEDLANQFRLLGGGYAVEGEYQMADFVRGALNEVYRKYEQWSSLPEAEQATHRDMVGSALQQLSLVLQYELSKINLQASTQTIRSRIMLIFVAFLVLFEVVLIGTLLRRWLLWPMERLNRQVEALGRDEPAAEPLLTSPREMATLARAMDDARKSLHELRLRLIDSERLTVIGQMAAQLAHNLRNPLASIRAAAQLAMRHPDLPEPQRQRMSDIIASVDRLNRWVMGIMEIARRDPTLTRESDVLPTVQRAADAVAEELAAKELRLTVSVPKEAVVCAHDPATLEHALIAMLVNAVEASPLGQTIELRLTTRFTNEAALCTIAVCDHGSGLPADAPERIFEFSYSTKQTGLGLGLALARQALQRQGGSTHAFNNPDGGATVYIELPLHRETEDGLQAAETLEVPAARAPQSENRITTS